MPVDAESIIGDDEHEYPKVGDHVQVVFESDAATWYHCTVVKVDPSSYGFNAKCAGNTYFIPCIPHESWRVCEKICKTKSALTQEELDLVSREE